MSSTTIPIYSQVLKTMTIRWLKSIRCSSPVSLQKAPARTHPRQRRRAEGLPSGDVINPLDAKNAALPAAIASVIY